VKKCEKRFDAIKKNSWQKEIKRNALDDVDQKEKVSLWDFVCVFMQFFWARLDLCEALAFQFHFEPLISVPYFLKRLLSFNVKGFENI
jgi:hypothetical protein